MEPANKVAWHEGMFIKPQHFQHQARYHTEQLSNQQSTAFPFMWGFKTLTIDTLHASSGNIGITECTGIFQDRTYFDLSNGVKPGSVLVTESDVGKRLYIGIPMMSESGQMFNTGSDLSRYKTEETDVVDANYGREEKVSVSVGRLSFHLLKESDDLSSYFVLPFARVKEVETNNNVILDDSFIAPAVNITASPYLLNFIQSFTAKLKHRAESIASRLGEVDQQGVSSVSDFMLLQLVNRYEPLFSHIDQTHVIHPEPFYQMLLQLEGELATLCSNERRAQTYQVYKQADLTETFSKIIPRLQLLLSTMSEQRVVSMPLSDSGYGIRTSAITNASMVDQMDFILAVKADESLDILLSNFVKQTKIASRERIRDLVNLQIPGIPLKAMSVVPRSLPYHAGYTYFALDKACDEWSNLSNSSAIAIHITGEFRNLSLELWAVR